MMAILIDLLRDPLISGAIITILTLVMVMARRTTLGEGSRKGKDTVLILVGGLITFVFLSAVGWVTPARIPPLFPSERATTHPTSLPLQIMPATLVATPIPTFEPTRTPEPTPSPTARPLLSRSITQELNTFCVAIRNRNYEVAWGQYSPSLQHKHAYADVIAAWRHFTNCVLPDQSADPTAFTNFTVDMQDGYVDQYGFINQASYRVTMQVEAQRWKVTHICHIISEGCYPISWG